MVALRRHGAVLLCAVGVLYGVFTVGVYLPRIAPHFGQRELFLAYYEARHGPHEPIVAYQMNWKGENFYSGNRLPAFVSSGAKFKTWLKAQRKRGTRVVYFVTEHGRISTLKSELGAGARLDAVTDKRLNDKFALVRVERGPLRSTGPVAKMRTPGVPCRPPRARTPPYSSPSPSDGTHVQLRRSVERLDSRLPYP